MNLTGLKIFHPVLVVAEYSENGVNFTKRFDCAVDYTTGEVSGELPDEVRKVLFSRKANLSFDASHISVQVANIKQLAEQKKNSLLDGVPSVRNQSEYKPA